MLAHLGGGDLLHEVPEEVADHCCVQPDAGDVGKHVDAVRQLQAGKAAANQARTGFRVQG